MRRSRRPPDYRRALVACFPRLLARTPSGLPAGAKGKRAVPGPRGVLLAGRAGRGVGPDYRPNPAVHRARLRLSVFLLNCAAAPPPAAQYAKKPKGANQRRGGGGGVRVRRRLFFRRRRLRRRLQKSRIFLNTKCNTSESHRFKTAPGKSFCADCRITGTGAKGTSHPVMGWLALPPVGAKPFYF